MPVHFKGRSEYDLNYLWRDSFRSRSFSPTKEQTAPVAGLNSAFINRKTEPALQRKKKVAILDEHQTFVMKPSEPTMQSKKRVEIQTSPVKLNNEPMMQAKKRVQQDFIKTAPEKSIECDAPMQSKKRVEGPSPGQSIQCEPPLQSRRKAPGPPTTLSNGFYERKYSQDDFALLGAQDKFASNVKYRVQSSHSNRDISPPKQMKLQKKQKENLLPASRPAPAPVVDTSQFSQPPTPLAPRRQKGQPDPVLEEIKESNVAKEASPKQKVVHSPKEQNRNTNAGKGAKVIPSLKFSDNDVRRSVAKPEQAKNMDRFEPVKDSMKTKKIGNMNEFVQTNMDKGVVDSGPEAPADYALKYKTGVAPPRPVKKFSEYQKQFQWKAGMPASPMLKAEQVVYNSNPTLQPPKKDVIPKVTEYQKQFKAFKLVPTPVVEAQEVPKKKSKLQRSKSLEDLTPAEIPTAGSAPVIAPDNRRLTLETNQCSRPQPAPQVPQKKSRQIRSEYDSNFKSPTKFNYLRGSWNGASSPQVQIQGPEDDRPTPALSNWFAEVIELRRRANEYRVRAQGTHFSREHLVQLMAKQADLWEASTTTARSTMSALSLESGISSARDMKDQQARRRQAYRAGASTAATIASEDDHVEDEPLSDESPAQKKQAWMDDVESPAMSSRSMEDFDDDEGRMTTPQMRYKIEESGNQRARHHLDRTTPSVGGAILSSPPQMKKKQTGKRMVSKSVDSFSIATGEDSARESSVINQRVHKPLAGQKTYLASTPAFGMPSRDTHYLRDDSQSVDQELHPQYVHSPDKGRSNKPAGGLSAIDEGYGKTYNKSRPSVGQQHQLSWTIDGGVPVGRRDEDDVLSVSMQSMASSCSLASETLERARRRKDDFWGKGGIATR